MDASNSDRQKAEEKTVFLKFVKTLNYSIVAGSLEQPEPRKPDILCEIEGQGQVAIELGEIMDIGYGKFKAFVNKRIAIETTMKDKYEHLPANHSLKVDKAIDNASICFRLKIGATERRFENILPEFWDLLVPVDNKYEGNILIPDKSNLKDVILEIEISRMENASGPIFSPDSVTSVGKPSFDDVKKKFSEEKYDTDLSIGLLFYFRDYPFPIDPWVSELKTEILENIQKSQFHTCWIFDYRGNGKVVATIQR